LRELLALGRRASPTPQREAAEEPASAEAALAHLRLEAPCASLPDQIGVARLGEPVVDDRPGELMSHGRMHAHMTAPRPVIFPRFLRSGYDGRRSVAGLIPGESHPERRRDRPCEASATAPNGGERCQIRRGPAPVDVTTDLGDRR
jgi:hypothetical protein